MNIKHPLAFYIICCIWLTGIVFIYVFENLSQSDFLQPKTLALPLLQNCTYYFTVTIEASGGLGNQLFKYAAAFTMSKVLGLSLNIRLRVEPANRQFTHRTRPYVLDQFNIPQENILVRGSKNDIDCVDDTCHHFNEIDVMSGQIPKLKSLAVGDYFESEIFFAPYEIEIRKMYTQIIDTSNIKNWLYKITNSESTSVAVHIRRGDFLTEPNSRTIPISYQIRGMKWLNTGKRITFYIFSDDIIYAKKHLENKFSNMMFVSNTNLTSLEEFYLMSKCTHFIIPNSTFSWWAAYLSIAINKIVIAPYPRYPHSWYRTFEDATWLAHKQKIYTNFSYPNGWLGLNPYSNEKPVPFKSSVFIYPQFVQDEYPKCKENKKNTN